MSVNPWVKTGKLREGRSILEAGRRALDPPMEKSRLKWYEDEEDALLREAYRVAGEASQATWSVPETPVKAKHSYFRLLTTARYCNSHSARMWPEEAIVYWLDAKRYLHPVIECRPGRGGNEFAVYVAGECGPRVVGPDDLMYVTDQPGVEGLTYQEICQ